MAALLVFLSSCLGWWYPWRKTKNIAIHREWETLPRYFLCTSAGGAGAFSLFCVSGGLLLPDPTNGGIGVAVLGAFILVALGLMLWRASRPQKLPHKNTHRKHQVESAHPLATSNVDKVTLPHEFIFSYVDHEGQATRRTVRVAGIASKDGREYLDGYCLNRKAMRTFRVDRIQSDLTDTETGELISIYRLLESTKDRRHMDYTPAKSFASTLPQATSTTVLFTGFSKGHKEALESLAEAAGWEVRTTVSQSLDYLVCGHKAGPAKVAKADELGVAVIDEEIFNVLIE